MQHCLLLISQSWDERVRSLMLFMHASALISFYAWQQRKIDLGRSWFLHSVIKCMHLWKDRVNCAFKMFWPSLYMAYGLSFLSPLCHKDTQWFSENQVLSELLKMEVNPVCETWLSRSAILFLENDIIQN